MNSPIQTTLCLDIGDRRIGIAHADSQVKLAVPYGVVIVDGTEFEQLQKAIDTIQPELIVAGFPRNQSGAETDQTEKVRRFVEKLDQFHLPIVFQDESLTSVEAEMRLQQRKKQYSKEDIDAEAAVIILQDYMERTYGH